MPATYSSRYLCICI